MRRLLAAFDLTESELISAVAQCRAILSGARPPVFSADPVEAAAQALLLERAIAKWQAINTAVFWHVLASIDLKSQHTLRDMRFIEALYFGRLADGVALLRYLHRFANTDDSSVHSGC